MKNTINLGARTTIIPTEIIYLEGDCNYTIGHSEGGKAKVYSITMKRILEQVDSHGDFLRISRKYAVNTRFIKRYTNNKLQLANGQWLEPSRRKLPYVLEALTQ